MIKAQDMLWIKKSQHLTTHLQTIHKYTNNFQTNDTFTRYVVTNDRCIKY